MPPQNTCAESSFQHIHRSHRPHPIQQYYEIKSKCMPHRFAFYFWIYGIEGEYRIPCRAHGSRHLSHSEGINKR